MKLDHFVAAVALAISAVLSAGSCASSAQPRSTLPGSPSPDQLAQFWVEPEPDRDLYWGPWGEEHAPRADAVFEFRETKTGGYSPKWEVRDPEGRKWSVKMGPEASSEVTTSRILWGLGYHQMPNYYLGRWKVGRDGQVQTGSPARFRPAVKELDSKGEWAWDRNPFADTVQYRGLLVLMAMLNSADLKNNNNSVFELPRSRDGARRWYVVRDVGSSLGDTGWTPDRNDIEAFEQTPFITGVEGGLLRFAIKGRWAGRFAHLRVEDARWIGQRLERLSDRQWHDAFKAGGYDEPTTERYLGAIKKRMAQALSPEEGEAKGRT